MTLKTKTPAESSSNTRTQRKAKMSLDQRLGIPQEATDSVRKAVELSGLNYESFVRAITASALSELYIWTQSDLERLLVAARLHGLNPLNREIFLIGNSQDSAPLIAVGVDGWAKIMNTHPQFAGMLFNESEETSNGIPVWLECEIHRHDRVVPLRVREYFEESRCEQMAWLTHPRRMLRHKCMVQCARLAFGLGGIYDADEARRIKQSKLAASTGFKKPRQNEPKGLAALAQSLENFNSGG